jgi:hypothetical protein
VFVNTACGVCFAPFEIGRPIERHEDSPGVVIRIIDLLGCVLRLDPVSFTKALGIPFVGTAGVT